MKLIEETVDDVLLITETSEEARILAKVLRVAGGPGGMLMLGPNTWPATPEDSMTLRLFPVTKK
ncbi:MAG: hypothetical protein A2566_00825 [Candidatus Zambryskibacteria bacterium RIFOXYD1_FULL_40_13]|nr:MAG: hypothetical protein UT25_C0001G0152 [Parcubacteria group bacterium GW2011_GWC1_39_12]KKR19676.1 MAG: hypothetical protein UT49_C0001G0152 [Parcubacteria group bacterium GW2011_GWF1_39_37]KKR35832.1 MAG: hypothetical protein UT68_C0001G0155 [Parcubacteria group bacterium GW2011_GWC2_40_10]KKR52644.1 MAG: hypothetical protein UT89_C0001G0152 [Parcubacteria group bacterium GW2011_GWE1_40_20]KKR65663.1 MAG: hypothetical protein UU06_C0013G0009 [Parcubacteria group bacterium GW2011_GWB1_40_